MPEAVSTAAMQWLLTSQLSLGIVDSLQCGHSLMVKFQPSKLAMRVRFPLPAHCLFICKLQVFLNIQLAFSVTFRTVETHLSAENMKRVRFPIVKKRGSSEAKIYRDRKPEGTYYRVVYYTHETEKGEDGKEKTVSKRHRLNFSDLQEAENEAEAKASWLSRLDGDALRFSGHDRQIYATALDVLKEFGVPLDAVANEYKQAKNALDGAPLIRRAAEFYARHHRGIKRKSVAEAVTEMIDKKTLKGVSNVYRRDLSYRLGQFAQSFHCDVNQIAPDDVVCFFEHLRLSPRSHNNFLRAIRTFFRFAQRHGWLSKEVDLLERVEKQTEKRRNPSAKSWMTRNVIPAPRCPWISV